MELEELKRKVCNLDGEADASGDLESTEKSGEREEPFQFSDVASL